ncbi:MAG TPA: hypothetical protein VGN37_01715 [Actinocatenispora sp.]
MTGGWLDALPEPVRGRARRADQPRTIAPMLAVLTDRRFSDPDWLYERKLDGERVLAYVEGGRVTLRSRTGRDVSGGYPELVESLADVVGADAVLDGEVVAFEHSRTSFARLQRRMQLSDPDRARATGVAVYHYLFDVVHVDGWDIARIPLRHRKSVLRRLVAFDDPVRFTAHRNEHGERYLAHACAHGWEGLVAKRADAPYMGRRSPDWLKLKCVAEQEFVVGGFTEPAGSRTGFGALLVGYHADGALRYAGKVGTGYDRATRRRACAAYRDGRRCHGRWAGRSRRTPEGGGRNRLGGGGISPAALADFRVFPGRAPSAPTVAWEPTRGGAVGDHGSSRARRHGGGADAGEDPSTVGGWSCSRRPRTGPAWFGSPAGSTRIPPARSVSACTPPYATATGRC